jgi:anti-sigma regulatory factor (Ser/Thr protein kinase)
VERTRLKQSDAEGGDDAVTDGLRAGRRPAVDARAPHDALFFDSAQQLAEVAGPFLTRGLAEGDAAVAVVSTQTAGVLAEAVDGDPRLHVLDTAEIYGSRTPAAITAFRRLAQEHDPGGGRQVRVVGEVDFGTTHREWLEWQRYEAVLNEAFSGWPLWGLCLFDTRRLAGPVLESARHTHSHVATPAGRHANPGFVDPGDYLRSLPVPDEPLESTEPVLAVTDVDDFAALRHAVTGALAPLRAHPERAEDFLLAVDEMTSNAIRHGAPPVSLRLWIAEDRVVCAVGDGGPGWDDPFAGYGPAHGEDLSRGGMGLWLARQLCDHVDISGDPARDGGVRVRLTTRFR